MEEAQKRGIPSELVNPLDLALCAGPDGLSIASTKGTALPARDSVWLPRIGASFSDYGLLVLDQMEAQGYKLIHSSNAIAQSRNKWRCLQVLAAQKIAVPRSIITRGALSALRGKEKNFLGKYPFVLKLLRGTQGVGVGLAETYESWVAFNDTMRSLETDWLSQEFLLEAERKDVRAFVVGNRVVSAMYRIAPQGDFRSNIHRGAKGERVPEADLKSGGLADIAVRAAHAVGLSVAGVDLMIRPAPLRIRITS